MRILNLIVDKLRAIVHGIAEKIHDKIEEHRDIPPEMLAERLDELAANDAQKLKWRTSIVDLLKLLDLDSSLPARREMAKDFGRNAFNGESEENIWLHREVFRSLSEHGIPMPKPE